MRIERLSPKQTEILCWWSEGSPLRHRDGLICDGAIRSGKTLCLSLSFLLWSMETFRDRDFGLCGKTIVALRRNLVTPLIRVAEPLGFRCEPALSRNVLEVTMGDVTNRYHLFGAKDEGSASHIQGVTLAGVLLDEVALMPQSFVEQAVARCSVEGSRFFLSCNPEHPQHWFYTDWILGREGKNLAYVHLTMEDNPGLSEGIRRRYRAMYQGQFYRRYIQGEWAASEGAVYPMFEPGRHLVEELPETRRHVISCDYGTVNPASFGLWGEREGVWYRLREYYHDSRKAGVQLTDEEYCDALEELAGDTPVELVLVDPSASSFLQCIRRRGRFRAAPAKNDLMDGIRLVAGALATGKIRFHRGCRDAVREFYRYRWQPGRRDVPVKEEDHAMDEIRYFCTWLSGAGRGGFALPRAAVTRVGVR